MLERATGMSYRDHVRANVFAPAGMTRSDFLRMDVVEPDAAVPADYRPPPSASAAGAASRGSLR